MNVKVIMIISVLATVLGISLSYATLSQVVEIESVGAVRAANWDIHFDDLSDETVTGEVVVNTAPSIVPETTAIRNLDFRFNSINSSITYYFDVVNEGDLKAKIGNITIEDPVCTALTEIDGPITAQDDEDSVCNGLTITLKYAGPDGLDVALDDELLPGDVKRMEFKIDFQDNRLPINEVSITNIKVSLNYVQLD